MKKLSKPSPVFVAFLQVIAVAIYVLALSFAVNNFSQFLEGDSFNNPVLGMSFFLLVFVTSALICGASVLGYPLYLFLSNEKRKAITIVLWSAFWFVIILILIGLSSVLLASNSLHAL